MPVVFGLFQVARPYNPVWPQLLSKLLENYDHRSLALSGMQDGATTIARTIGTKLFPGKNCGEFYRIKKKHLRNSWTTKETS